MKKIASFILFTIFCFSANAQFSIMPKAGISYSNVAFSDDLKGFFGSETDFKHRLGLMGGVAFNYAFGDMFSVQPEILISHKGFRFVETGSGNGQLHFIINYIEIPVLAKATFGSESFNFFVEGGPYLGIGLGGKGKYKNISGADDFKIKFGMEPENNQSDDWYLDNRLDFGLQVGAGAGLNLGPGQVGLDARYGLGFSNYFDTEGQFKDSGLSKEQLKSKNHTLAVTLGYMIPF